VSISHPDSGQFITVSRGDQFDSSDPIVKHFPWLFAPVPDIETDAGGRPIEDATSFPGKSRRPLR